MPIDNRKAAAGFERVPGCPRQAGFVGHAVEGACHEHEVSRVSDQFSHVIRIAGDEGAIGHFILGQTRSRGLKKFGVDVDGDDAACQLGDLQCELAIAGAKVANLHAGRESNCNEHIA